MVTIEKEQHHIPGYVTYPISVSKGLVALIVLGIVTVSLCVGCGETTKQKYERGVTTTEGSVSEAWKHDYNKGKWMESNAITVDDAGFIYATGYGTVKYDCEGNKLWKARTDDFVGKDIIVDNQGNVYVTGTSHKDYTTIKYDSGGDKIWSKRYNLNLSCFILKCSVVENPHTVLYINNYKKFSFTSQS